MKRLSLAARVVLALVTLGGLAVFLIIVDVGISAGRIHSGVTVAGYDVGGLTREEALLALEKRGALLRERPVVLVAEGVHYYFSPASVGWVPQAAATADAAMRIGRDGIPFRALGDRLRAWLSGVDISWAGSARPAKVSGVIDEVELRAEALGLEIKRGKLRLRIRRAIESWPRAPVKIPIVRSS